MVRPIITDLLLLQKKSVPATAADLNTAQDLLDTLQANAHHCVGMAANMIGVQKRIIAVSLGGIPVVMLNPVLVRHAGTPFTAQESCLSLSGIRSAQRYPSVTVSFQDRNLRPQQQSFSGLTAQIVQHEMDHLEGILI